jgi:hypothetical protein
MRLVANAGIAGRTLLVFAGRLLVNMPPAIHSVGGVVGLKR